MCRDPVVHQARARERPGHVPGMQADSNASTFLDVVQQLRAKRTRGARENGPQPSHLGGVAALPDGRQQPRVEPAEAGGHRGPIGLRSRFQMSRPARWAPITSCPSASTTSATQREVTRPPARHGPPCTCRGASRSCRGGESRFRRGRPRGRPIVQRAWRVFAAAKAVPVRASAATWLALRKQPHPAPAQGRPSSTDETSFLPPERCRPSRPPCLFHVEHRSALDSVTGPTVRGSRQPPSPARLALVPATARLAPRPLPFTALPSPLGFDSGATRAPTTPRGDLRRLAQTRRARPRTGRSHLPSRAAPPPP